MGPAFLLTLHSQTNFDYDSKKQRQCINGLYLALCINRYLVIERERERERGGGGFIFRNENTFILSASTTPPTQTLFCSQTLTVIIKTIVMSKWAPLNPLK